jgi:hypothetical protein
VPSCSVQPSIREFEHPTLRTGSVSFIARIVVVVVVVLICTLFHASSEDLTNHPVVFAVYAQRDPG